MKDKEKVLDVLKIFEQLKKLGFSMYHIPIEEYEMWIVWQKKDLIV